MSKAVANLNRSLGMGAQDFILYCKRDCIVHADVFSNVSCTLFSYKSKIARELRSFISMFLKVKICIKNNHQLHQDLVYDGNSEMQCCVARFGIVKVWIGSIHKHHSGFFHMASYLTGGALHLCRHGYAELMTHQLELGQP